MGADLPRGLPGGPKRGKQSDPLLHSSTGKRGGGEAPVLSAAKPGERGEGGKVLIY